MINNTLKKKKTSKQRDLILQILRSTKSHPTANWIYEQAKLQLPNISLGTVYRNLALLKQEGRIRELSWGSGTGQYDGDLRSHDHVCCTACGKVEDIPPLGQGSESEAVEKLMGYRIHAHRLEFFGTCPQCNRLRETA
jgi:Fur family transcriptional regulator, peroxide stress response regulator